MLWRPISPVLYGIGPEDRLTRSCTSKICSSSPPSSSSRVWGVTGSGLDHDEIRYGSKHVKTCSSFFSHANLMLGIYIYTHIIYTHTHIFLRNSCDFSRLIGGMKIQPNSSGLIDHWRETFGNRTDAMKQSSALPCPVCKSVKKLGNPKSRGFSWFPAWKWSAIGPWLRFSCLPTSALCLFLVYLPFRDESQMSWKNWVKHLTDHMTHFPAVTDRGWLGAEEWEVMRAENQGLQEPAAAGTITHQSSRYDQG